MVALSLPLLSPFPFSLSLPRSVLSVSALSFCLASLSLPSLSPPFSLFTIIHTGYSVAFSRCLSLGLSPLGGHWWSVLGFVPHTPLHSTVWIVQLRHIALSMILNWEHLLQNAERNPNFIEAFSAIRLQLSENQEADSFLAQLCRSVQPPPHSSPPWPSTSFSPFSFFAI